MFHLFGLQKPIFSPPVSAVRPSGFAASRKTATRQSPLRAPGLDGTNNRNTLFGVKNIIKHNIYIYAFNTYYIHIHVYYIYILYYLYYMYCNFYNHYNHHSMEIDLSTVYLLFCFMANLRDSMCSDQSYNFT